MIGAVPSRRTARSMPFVVAVGRVRSATQLADTEQVHEPELQLQVAGVGADVSSRSSTRRACTVAFRSITSTARSQRRRQLRAPQLPRPSQDDVERRAQLV